MIRIQRNSSERLPFEFRDNNDALIDPINPTVTIESQSGISLIDRDAVALTGVTLIKESLGVFYWTFKPKVDAVLGIYYAWPKGTVNGILKELDAPIEIEIIDQEVAPVTTLLVPLSLVKELNNIRNTEQDALLASLIQRATTMVENFCNRKFKAARYTEYTDGDGRAKEVFVHNPPLLVVNSIFDDPDRKFGNNTAFASADFVIDSDAGIIELVQLSSSTLRPTDRVSFNRGTQNIKVIYTGGYNTIPNDIEMATAIWVTHLYRRIDEKSWRISNRTISNNSQNFEAQEQITQDGRRRVTGMPHEVREILMGYQLGPVLL